MSLLRRILDEYVSRHHREHGRREVAFSVGIAMALAAGALFGIAWAAGFGDVASRLAHPHWHWFLFALGGLVVSLLGYTVAYRELARVDEGPELPVHHAGALVAGGFGLFIPRGGFALDQEALLDAGVPPREAEMRVRRLGLLEYAILAPAALCSAIAILVDGEDISHTLTLPWLAVIPGAIAAVWVSSPKRAARFADARGRGRIRQALAHGVAGLAILRSMFVAPPREHGLGLVGTALYWAGDIACLWGALQVFGNPRLSIPALILGYATGYVLTRRSLPAGGAGIVEIALTFALHWVGFPFVRALLGVVVYRMFNLWLPILPALAVLPHVNELRRELDQVGGD